MPRLMRAGDLRLEKAGDLTLTNRTPFFSLIGAGRKLTLSTLAAFERVAIATVVIDLSAEMAGTGSLLLVMGRKSLVKDAKVGADGGH